MATTTTPSKDVRLESVIDAMRTVQSEDDRWHLAEALHKLIPSGSNGFGDIIDAASKEGVLGKLSVTTLRLYRDTSARWPKSSRIPGVSFSAHREAMVMIGSDGSTKRAEKLLTDLAKQGPDKVTVASVRKNAAIQQGKTPNSTTRTASKGIDVLADLESGAKQLLDAINSVGSDGAKLDKLHAGLSKALQRVESLKVKVAQKAKSTPKPTSPAAKPATTNGSSKKPAGSKRGDLRNL